MGARKEVKPRAAKAPLRVLVANRGEIALRLVRGLRALGHETIAIYSDVDRDALHVRHAHRAVAIGGASARESYLDIARVIAAGQSAGAGAVHPGYGFLSENPRFAAAVEAEGWIFIGPTPDNMTALGDKTSARRIAEEAGVPVTPSVVPGAGDDIARTLRAAAALGFPLLLKAAAGGGGKGMRVVRTSAELADQFPSAAREAESAFGDGRIFVERYIEGARHVEVQILGDGKGGAVAVGERDCTLQRRHQKIIEESPAPGLDARTRSALESAARSLAERVRYRGAGTVEFLLAPDGQFYFLEVNTRLQVEHPVTELVHGIDLVAAQVSIARGGPLPDVAPARGHAIEVRISAENPEADFMPSVGRIALAHFPTGPGVRVDTGVETGSEITVHYDPLMAKIIVHAETRERAIDQMRAALADTLIAGVDTTIPFARALIDTPEFRRGEIHTHLAGEIAARWQKPAIEEGWGTAAIAAARHLLATGASAPGRGTPLLWETLRDWRMSTS